MSSAVPSVVPSAVPPAVPSAVPSAVTDNPSNNGDETTIYSGTAIAFSPTSTLIPLAQHGYPPSHQRLLASSGDDECESFAFSDIEDIAYAATPPLPSNHGANDVTRYQALHFGYSKPLTLPSATTTSATVEHTHTSHAISNSIECMA